MSKLWQTSSTILALAFLAAPTLPAAAQTAAAQAPQAQTSAMSSRSKVDAADRSFMRKAARGGMLEVELGKVAQQKAMNDQVKQFGARMEQDHSKANGELKQIAANKGVDLPAAPNKKEQKEMDKLKNMSGAEFDRAYMKHMVADHKKDIAAFEREAKDGRDADVKSFAEKTLPTLRQHLEMAQQAQKTVQRAKAEK